MHLERTERQLFPSVAAVLSAVRDEAVLVGSAVTACTVKDCKDIDIVVSMRGLKRLVKRYRFAMNQTANGAYTLYAYEKIIDVFYSDSLDLACERKNGDRITYEKAIAGSLLEARPYGAHMRAVPPRRGID